MIPVRVDENLYEYLKEADEVVMSPHTNVSIRMEMTRVATSMKPCWYRMMSDPLERKDEIFGTVGSSQGIRASRRRDVGVED